MYGVGCIVEVEDIVSKFGTILWNHVCAGIDHVDCREHYSYFLSRCTHILGSLSEIGDLWHPGGVEHPIGKVNNPVYGSNVGNFYGSIYGGLTMMTKLLLKFGTWEYLKEYQHNATYKGHVDPTIHADGRCIFSNDAVLRCFRVNSLMELPISPPAGEISPGKPITFKAVDDFVGQCASLWASSPKVHLSMVNSTCYGNCHVNENWYECHTNNCYDGPPLASDWWGNPECYHNGASIGFPSGNPRPDHKNSAGGWKHKNEGDSTADFNSCHDNYDRLSLTSPYGGCNTITDISHSLSCHTNTSCHS